MLPPLYPPQQFKKKPKTSDMIICYCLQPHSCLDFPLNNLRKIELPTVVNVHKVMFIKGKCPIEAVFLSALILNSIDMVLCVIPFHFVQLFMNSKDTVGARIKRNF